MKVEHIGNATLYLGDCLEILPTLDKVDAVVTDPPYPDCFVDEYKYHENILNPLRKLDCKQLVFWSGREPFPISSTAVHIWNKNPSNAGAQYERIFERNGNKHQKVFTYYMVNSSVSAKMTGDKLYNHSSQKPIHLMIKLCSAFFPFNNVFLDPFMGSGTTGVACVNLGRKFIGIEIEEKYFDIACERITAAQSQMRLFA